jgi:hypothetical protein
VVAPVTAAAKTLAASQARKLERLEVAAARAEAAAKAAKDERDEYRAQVLPLLPVSDDPKDADKDVRQAIAGGILVRVSTFDGGEYFSLKDYRTAGNAITAEMEPHVHSGDPRSRWTVKDTRGPKSSQAVEPRP